MSALTSSHAQFKEEFLATWKNSQDYTLQVARLMPEAQYTYRPFAEAKSFGEQMVHISEAMMYHADIALSLNDSRPSPNSDDKEAVIQYLRASYALVERHLERMNASDLEQRVKFWGGPTSRRKILTFAADHITHHRGQAIVYLRMNSVKPPNYIGW